MYKLYYMPLNFFCRAARIILIEKNISFKIVNEPYWKRRVEFLKINPAGDLPVIVDMEGVNIIGYECLVEYLDEKKLGKTLLGNNAIEKLEVRRLCMWVGKKLQKEVMENILDERVFNSLKKNSQPSTTVLNAGRKNLKNHMKYFEWILERRSFLAGDFFTVADIALAAAISSLDYLSEINWENYNKVKNWYSVIKSRPSFREILEESIYNISPSAHYKDLDF
ncbi:MAG: glutathione S-transferase family protein [Alphaproteobacteria bacterium TMED93]|nr:MAG: glutathione S-transferase family protein [Alphaproteobacteria bacterium TMED93]